MRRSLSLLIAAFLVSANVQAQEAVGASAATPEPQASATVPPEEKPLPQPRPQKRSWFGRILHPFGSAKRTAPEYKDPKLRGLVLDLQISPQTVRLSEV